MTRTLSTLAQQSKFLNKKYQIFLKLARLILGGKYTSQNPLGYLYCWKEIYVSNLQQVFTETRLEDADLSKPQPWKYFVYMDQGNPSQD